MGRMRDAGKRREKAGEGCGRMGYAGGKMGKEEGYLASHTTLKGLFFSISHNHQWAQVGMQQQLDNACP